MKKLKVSPNPPKTIGEKKGESVSCKFQQGRSEEILEKSENSLTRVLHRWIWIAKFVS